MHIILIVSLRMQALLAVLPRVLREASSLLLDSIFLLFLIAALAEPFDGRAILKDAFSRQPA
jgi:hypothetical protein